MPSISFPCLILVFGMINTKQGATQSLTSHTGQ